MGLRAGRQSRFCGCGTLVESGGKQFILTAAHCAEALSTWPKIDLGLGEYVHSFNFPNESPAITLKGKEFGEWGPDLAYLPIPAAAVADLRARKVFCNLDRSERAMLLENPDTHLGLWAVVGAPALTSSLDQHHLQLSQTAFFVQIAKTYRRNRYDYLDMALPVGRQGIPPSFAGVSGGGLWQIDILRDPDGQWFSKDAPHLEGVAYYENHDQQSFVVRCHGRRSIYGRGLAAVRAVSI
jgi:hypothetical protein